MNKNEYIRWLSPNLAEILPGYIEGMQTSARVVVNRDFFSNLEEEALLQLASITLLPGLIAPPVAMPDIHTGYGFPIGGVAAFSLSEGVISPGGVGYDINCGVRLLGTQLLKKDLNPDKISRLLNIIYNEIPVGVGATSCFKLNHKDLKKVVEQGSKWVWNNFLCEPYGKEQIEYEGCFEEVDFSLLSKRAREKGRVQLGTLGGGNHFIEVSFIEEIYLREEANKLGIFPEQIVFLFHSGSRGLGHQVASDYLKKMQGEFLRQFKKAAHFPKLCSTYFQSVLGQEYYMAMQSASNWAWANRTLIAEKIIFSLENLLKLSREKLGVYLLGDISHNIARKEQLKINGKELKVLIHRKGAIKANLIEQNIPIILPGDMLRGSYLLTATRKAYSDLLNSVSHGAGRVLSRRRAMKEKSAGEVLQEMDGAGIQLRVEKLKNLPQEMSQAYKNIDSVVDILTAGNYIKKIAKIKSLGVIKG
jgi:tRNA-splicing ligase RtcB